MAKKLISVGTPNFPMWISAKDDYFVVPCIEADLDLEGKEIILRTRIIAVKGNIRLDSPLQPHQVAKAIENSNDGIPGVDDYE